MIRKLIIAGVLVSSAALAGCEDYYGPPPGYVGPARAYRIHVRRCLDAYPNYRPRIDAIVGPDGPRPCPL